MEKSIAIPSSETRRFAALHSRSFALLRIPLIDLPSLGVLNSGAVSEKLANLQGAPQVEALEASCTGGFIDPHRFLESRGKLRQPISLK
jgi:hypothetical protein